MSCRNVPSLTELHLKKAVRGLISSTCANHSTETALIKVVNDICLNTDSGKISVPVLLDLSVAFEHCVGFSGAVIHWLKSYLEDRSFFVAIGDCTSTPTSLTCGVPQGTPLGATVIHPVHASTWSNYEE